MVDRPECHLPAVHSDVAPECVDARNVLPGETEHERELNARYALSCVLKMGCVTFIVWEDIVEARAKMILTVLAALMAEELRRAHLAAAARDEA